jgi:hypothetical protein
MYKMPTLPNMSFISTTSALAEKSVHTGCCVGLGPLGAEDKEVYHFWLVVQ